MAGTLEEKMRMLTTITVRGVDRELYRRFKLAAKAEGKTVGQALNAAMRIWLAERA